MFTHSVVFKLGDGGKFVTAQFSFTKEGVISTLITQTSTPLPLDFFEDFTAFGKELSRLYVKYGGIKNMSVVEKGVETVAISDLTNAAKVK